MRPLLILVALLTAVLPLFGDELFYRSNDFGMPLARIREYQKKDSRWVLQVGRSGLDEVRRLFEEGKEVRRWEITQKSASAERVERETAGGQLTARRVYDASGALLQEEEYKAGALSKKTLCTYAGGKLARTRVLGADGGEISTETYVYAAGGGLREVRRTVSSGAAALSSAVAGAAGVSEERSVMEGSLFITRYGTDGKLRNRERRVDGATESGEEFAYDPDSGSLSSSRETRPSEGVVVDRRYDADGRISEESTSVKGALRERTGYERDGDGRVTVKTRRGPGGLETWKYSYTEAGTLLREEYFRRGILEKVTIHGEGKLRTEEMYREGEIVLKAYFDGDTRLREEVYADGSLLRERFYK
jgi:antitoxin component YwqK of YwqJK toxin-antitoxin module